MSISGSNGIIDNRSVAYSGRSAFPVQLLAEGDQLKGKWFRSVIGYGSGFGSRNLADYQSGNISPWTAATLDAGGNCALYVGGSPPPTSAMNVNPDDNWESLGVPEWYTPPALDGYAARIPNAWLPDLIAITVKRWADIRNYCASIGRDPDHSLIFEMCNEPRFVLADSTFMKGAFLVAAAKGQATAKVEGAANWTEYFARHGGRARRNFAVVVNGKRRYIAAVPHSDGSLTAIQECVNGEIHPGLMEAVPDGTPIASTLSSGYGPSAIQVPSGIPASAKVITFGEFQQSRFYAASPTGGMGMYATAFVVCDPAGTRVVRGEISADGRVLSFVQEWNGKVWHEGLVTPIAAKTVIHMQRLVESSGRVGWRPYDAAIDDTYTAISNAIRQAFPTQPQATPSVFGGTFYQDGDTPTTQYAHKNRCAIWVAGWSGSPPGFLRNCAYLNFHQYQQSIFSSTSLATPAGKNASNWSGLVNYCNAADVYVEHLGQLRTWFGKYLLGKKLMLGEWNTTSTSIGLSYYDDFACGAMARSCGESIASDGKLDVATAYAESPPWMGVDARGRLTRFGAGMLGLGYNDPTPTTELYGTKFTNAGSGIESQPLQNGTSPE